MLKQIVCDPISLLFTRGPAVRYLVMLPSFWARFGITDKTAQWIFFIGFWTRAILTIAGEVMDAADRESHIMHPPQPCRKRISHLYLRYIMLR